MYLTRDTLFIDAFSSLTFFVVTILLFLPKFTKGSTISFIRVSNGMSMSPWPFCMSWSALPDLQRLSCSPHTLRPFGFYAFTEYLL